MNLNDLYSEQEDSKDVVFLYYAVSGKEFEYIVNHQYKLFPVRFFNKPHLSPMLNKEYAQRVASERSNWSPYVHTVYLLRFLVLGSSLTKYLQGSIDNSRTLIVISKGELQQFNKHIIGYIECIETYNLGNSTNQLASL